MAGDPIIIGMFGLAALVAIVAVAVVVVTEIQFRRAMRRMSAASRRWPVGSLEVTDGPG